MKGPIHVTTHAGEELELTVRTVIGDDYAQCEDLQRHTWGEDFGELVPASMMMINQKLGGVVAGAFDAEGRLWSFVLGQTGVRHGRLLHWSHMMATHSELRGCGIGRHLKLFQRRFLLDMDVEEAEWTYDPLESRNAHLNLNRLGARPIEYIRDAYGDGSNSELWGMSTDRFVTAWSLKSPEVEAVVADEEIAVPGLDALIVNVTPDGASLEPPFDLPDLEALRVEIPSDIQAVKTESMALAKRWRASTRFAFETCFERGCRIPHFHYDRASQRSFYIVIKT